jgi:hypothetical protein
VPRAKLPPDAFPGVIHAAMSFISGPARLRISALTDSYGGVWADGAGDRAPATLSVRLDQAPRDGIRPVAVWGRLDAGIREPSEPG